MGSTADGVVEKLTLFSALPVQALLNEHEAGFVEEPANRQILQSMWESANQAYATTSPSRSFIVPDDIRPLTGVEPSRIERLLKRIKVYPPYDSHTSGIFNVRIAKLVTPQITINMKRAEKRGKVRKAMSSSELVDLMFESAGAPERIVRQILGMGPNGGALIFTSYDEDIRLHHPPYFRRLPINEGDTAGPSFENMCLAVGGGLPFAAAMRVQIAPGKSRLVLNNGIHRTYRLAAAGYEWCPSLVVDVTPLEVPDPLVNLPSSILLSPSLNPPLITDFLDNRLVIRLTYHILLRTIRVNWTFEQYPTVLR